MKIKLLLLIICCYTTSFSQWQNEGTPNFSPGQASFIDLEIDNSEPYVVFRDALNGNGASLMKFDGTNWINIGPPGFTPSGAQANSLEFYNSYPHVAFIDGSVANAASVMAFDGSNWQNIGAAGFSAGGVDDIQLEFDGSTPYVAYADWTLGGNATVMRFVAGTWQTVGTPGFTAGTANDLSFTLIGSTPYVAYQDMAASNYISVMYFDGTNWIYAGTQGISVGAGDQTTLSNDGTNLFIGFRDLTVGQGASVMKFDGSSWTVVGTPTISAGGTDFLTIECLNNIPYIGYKDNANSFKATVQKFDGTSWINVGTAGFTPGQSLYNSIAFNDTVPYFAFQEYNSGSYTASVMKYIPCIDPETPTVSVSENSICQGESFTLNIDSGNLNDATEWHVYEGGCTGSSISSSPTGPFNIYPTGSATYYVRGEGGCVGFIPCVNFETISVSSVDTSVNITNDTYSAAAGTVSGYQWLDCDNNMFLLSGETNQTFTPSIDGNYAVEVTENGCVDTSGCQSIINVGIEKNSIMELAVYPNPADDHMMIEIPSNLINGQINLYDLQGNLVIYNPVNGNLYFELETNDLPNGIYYLNIYNDSQYYSTKLTICHH